MGSGLNCALLLLALGAPPSPDRASGAAKKLRLATAVAKEAAAYATAAAALEGGAPPEPLCALIDQGTALLAHLTPPLSDKWTKVWDKPRGQLFQTALKALTAELPGVVFETSEGDSLLSAFDPAALAKLAESKAARRLLEAVAAVETPTMPMSPFVRQQGDVTGCTDLVLGLKALRALADIWPTGNSCLRERLAPKLKETLADAADGSCFCRDSGPARTAAGSFAKMLQDLPELDGPAAGKAAIAAAHSSDAKFKCTGAEGGE